LENKRKEATRRRPLLTEPARCRMTNYSMVIVSEFTKTFNSAGEYFEITATHVPSCPVCHGRLKYRDSRSRQSTDRFGDRIICLLGRFVCECCGRLHTAIPDFIQPYKHYDSEAIQRALDGQWHDCAADDSTIRRWRADMAASEGDIAQRLASELAKAENAAVPIGSAADMFLGIHEGEKRWLAFAMRLLINAGHKLFTRFAFCPPEYADRVSPVGKTPGKGDEQHDETVDDTG